MPIKVLIVEDDKNIADLLRIYLEKEQMECELAGDGLVGVEKFRQFQPDLVLLDIMLPGMDGWAVCRKIRETSDAGYHAHSQGRAGGQGFRSGNGSGRLYYQAL